MMKHLSGKARMMMVGMAAGTTMAGILALLVAGGRIGWSGLAAVGLLIFLAGASGWLIGVQTRIQTDRGRAWMQGYKQGREEGQLVPAGSEAIRLFIGRR